MKPVVNTCRTHTYQESRNGALNKVVFGYDKRAIISVLI